MKISPVFYQNYQSGNSVQKLSKNRGKTLPARCEAVDTLTFKGDGGALKGIVGGGLLGAAAAGAVILTGGLAALAAAGVTTAAAIGCGAGLGAQLGGIIGGMTDDSSVEDLSEQVDNTIKKIKDKVGIK